MTMLKALIGLPILVVVLATVTACDDTGDTTTGPAPDLVVEFSDWNGWDPEHEATPREVALKGEVGERARIDVMGGIDLEIKAIDGDEVTIETSTEMAPETESGGVDMRDLTDTFVVTSDSPAVFATPTLDAGYNFEVRVEGGADENVPAPGTHSR